MALPWRVVMSWVSFCGCGCWVRSVGFGSVGFGWLVDSLDGRRALQRGEVVVEPVVVLVDGRGVALEPVLDRSERGTVQPVQPAASLGAAADEIDGAQHLEVLRHLRLTEVQLVDEFTDGDLAADQHVEDVATRLLGDGVEHVGGGGGAGHVGHHIPISVYVKQNA